MSSTHRSSRISSKMSSSKSNQPTCTSSSSSTNKELSVPTRRLLRHYKKKLNNSVVAMQKKTTVPVLSVSQSIGASVENITVQLDDFDRAHLEQQQSSEGPSTSTTNNNNTNQPENLIVCDISGCPFNTADSATLREHWKTHNFDPDDESELMVNGDHGDESAIVPTQQSSSSTTIVAAVAIATVSPPNANVPNDADDDDDDDGSEVTTTTTGESTGTETTGTESDNDSEEFGGKNNSSPKRNPNRPAQRGGGRGGHGGRGGKGRGRGRDIGGGFPRIQVEDDQNADIEDQNRDVADFADVADVNVGDANFANVAVADDDEDDAAGAAADDQQAPDDQLALYDNVPMVERPMAQIGHNQRPRRACTKSPLKRYGHGKNDENAKGARRLPGRRKSSRKARKSEVRIGIGLNDQQFEKISGAMKNNEQWAQVLQKRDKVKQLSLVVEF